MKRKDGTGHIRSDGRIHFSINNERKLGHILVAEKALGKPLPKGAQVHHMDRNPSNNDPRNLVICPSDSYHSLIHQRMRALEACGNANYLKCRFCKQYDDPKNMYVTKTGRTGTHRACTRLYQRSNYELKERFISVKKEQKLLFDKLANQTTRNKTHCVNGHAFTEENTYMTKIQGGKYYARVCRQCKANKIREKRAKQKNQP